MIEIKWWDNDWVNTKTSRIENLLAEIGQTATMIILKTSNDIENDTIQCISHFMIKI